MELKLDIHEFLLEFALSGGVTLPGFSVLPRLSSGGLLTGIFCDVKDAEEGVGGGESGVSTTGGGSGVLRSMWARSGGSPPL